MNFKFSKTQRGFPFMNFSDLYGAKCSIQLSSLADERAIWIGIDDANPQIMARDAFKLGLHQLLNYGPEQLNGWVDYPLHPEVQLTTRMHLSSEQVKALLPILIYFVEHGDLPRSINDVEGDKEGEMA